MTKRTGEYDDKPEADVLVRFINGRFNKGLGTNAAFIGLSGTGKSSSCQRLTEKIKESRPEENLTSFITDSLLKLLEAIKKSKQGDMIIVEEVSVLFPSRRAMAKDNVSVAKIFDTIRKKRLVLLLNFPLWKSLDNHIKSMCHVLIETLSINKTEGVVISKFFKLQCNASTSKIYKHTMTRQGRDVPLMFTRMPNKDDWKKYEADKDKFMDELYNRMSLEQVKKREKEDKDLGISPPKLRDLTTRELQVFKLYKDKLTQKEIAEKIGVCQQRVTAIMKNIVKKGRISKETPILT